MRVAILGAWHVHAPDYTKTALALGSVAGVYDPNPAFAADLSEKRGIPCFSSREELLASDAEGVIVCSSTDRHTDDVIAAIRAGKAVFTEKVLAQTSAECEKIEEELRKHPVPFVISLPQKYTSGVRTVKSVVDSGEIGRINYVRFRNCHNGSTGDWLPAHFYDKKECGGGAMIDLGAHGMYVIDFLRGLPEGYRSSFTLSCDAEPVLKKNRDRLEDNAVTVMTYADGCIAVNETGFVSYGCPMTLEVGGEDGYVTWSRDTVTKTTRATGKVPTPVPLLPALPSPAEQFLTGELLPGCGIEDAKRLTRMMEGAYSGR